MATPRVFPSEFPIERERISLHPLDASTLSSHPTYTISSAGSDGRRNTCLEFTRRVWKPKVFLVVEAQRDLVELRLRIGRQAVPIWRRATRQPRMANHCRDEAEVHRSRGNNRRKFDVRIEAKRERKAHRKRGSDSENDGAAALRSLSCWLLVVQIGSVEIGSWLRNSFATEPSAWLRVRPLRCLTVNPF